MADESQYPSALAEKFMLRLTPGMRDQIREAAKTAGRSMNAEILVRLQTAYTMSALRPGRVDPLPELPEYDETLRADLEHNLQLAGDKELLRTDPGKAVLAGLTALDLIDKQEGHLRWIIRSCNTYYSRLSKYRSKALSPFVRYHWEDMQRASEDEQPPTTSED